MSKVVFLNTIPCQQNWYSFGLTFRPNRLKKCEKNYWKDNLDRQWQRRREAGSGTATYNKTLNQRQGSCMGNFAQYISGRQTD